VERTIAHRACANPRDVEERVDFAKSLDARSHTLPNRGLISNIGCTERGIRQLRSESFALFGLHAHNEYALLRAPEARRRCRNSGRPSDEKDFAHMFPIV
jgi:hypothetical protein